MQTAEQLRAARAMLQLDQAEVAKGAGVSVETIKRLERMKGDLRAHPETMDSIRRYFQSKGLDFTPAAYGTATVSLVSDRLYRMQMDIRRLYIEKLTSVMLQVFSDLHRADRNDVDIREVFDRVADLMDGTRAQVREQLSRIKPYNPGLD